MLTWFALFHFQFGSQILRECFKQVIGYFDGLAQKLQLRLLLKLKMLSRLLSKNPFEGERPCEKAAPLWHFPWSLNHFHNLVWFLTEGCEDSHIKKPKDIPGYLEKERILFRKSWRNHLDYSKGKKKFEDNPKERKISLEGNSKGPLRIPKDERRFSKGKEDFVWGIPEGNT